MPNEQGSVAARLEREQARLGRTRLEVCGKTELAPQFGEHQAIGIDVHCAE